MKRFVIFSICLTVLILVFSPSGIAQKNQSKPNVIFVIIDDLGSAWIPPYAKNLKAGDVEEVIVEYKKKSKKVTQPLA